MSFWLVLLHPNVDQWNDKKMWSETVATFPLSKPFYSVRQTTNRINDKKKLKRYISF